MCIIVFHIMTIDFTMNYTDTHSLFHKSRNHVTSTASGICVYVLIIITRIIVIILLSLTLQLYITEWCLY